MLHDPLQLIRNKSHNNPAWLTTEIKIDHNYNLLLKRHYNIYHTNTDFTFSSFVKQPSSSSVISKISPHNKPRIFPPFSLKTIVVVIVYRFSSIQRSVKWNSARLQDTLSLKFPRKLKNFSQNIVSYGHSISPIKNKG